ncbi:MAG: chromate efflux transporter [Proteobacteria bacterium]|nr:chromate efflux transporter [Pseudomonadota bacterium]
MDATTKSENQSLQHPSFGEAAVYWTKLGFLSFGGPAGQIAMMQTECVDKKRWIDQGTFLRGLNYCMLLPGPEAQQLAAYIGWRLHGFWGAIYAGTAFFVPGMVLMIALAWLAAQHGDQGLVGAVFAGIKPVVMAVVAAAIYRIGKRAFKGPVPPVLAAMAFVALQFFSVPFPIVIFAAGVFGIVLARMIPGCLAGGGHGHDAPAGPGSERGADAELGRFVLLTIGFAVIWAAPVVLCIHLLGRNPFADVAELFTSAAFVTFGGAYAVLPYVANAAVNTYHWMSGTQMIDGLALAETTPGPLIMVTTYVGFFAGWATEGGNLVRAIWAALLTTHVTFLPSFYLILIGAPYVERLQRIDWAKNALSAITAAVVGVILNLAVFLSKAVLIAPDGSPHLLAIGGMLVAFALLIKGRIGVPALVGLGAVVGAAGMLIG